MATCRLFILMTFALMLLKHANNRPPIETKATPDIFNDKFNPIYT